MKPGTKAYLIMMRRIYWLTVTATVMGIPPLVIAIINKTAIWNAPIASFFLTPGLLIIGMFHFLSAFEPIVERLRWDRIFPELKEERNKFKNENSSMK